MTSPSETCVLIPTLNEAETIGEVIQDFQSHGFTNILVLDGGSTDETREIAHRAGARIHVQNGDGKGQAVREARDYIDAPYILMVDGDGTYHAEDAFKLLEALSDGATHVVGNRFAEMETGAMTRLNQIGNSIINSLFRTVHREDFVDVLSGYRAFTKDSFQQLYLNVDGFGIETQIAVEAVRNELQTEVVPIQYTKRPDGSASNLSPLSDGLRITKTLYSLAKLSNPVAYFGVIGGVSLLLSTLLASFIAFEWITTQTPHEILAVVTAFFGLTGVQFLIFGFLADILLSYHKAELHEIRRCHQKPKDSD